MGRSWLERNGIGLLSTAAGAALTATGVAAPIGIGMMGYGTSALAADDANERAKKQAERAQGFSQESANTQMRFQEQMSNSAQVRARQDAINAGYNPMLPAMQGNAASTPTGTSANGIDPKVVAAETGPSMASAIAYKKIENELTGTNSQIALNQSMGAKAVADANMSTASAKESVLRAAALKSQLKTIDKKAQADLKKSEYDLKFMDFDAINSRVGAGANSAGSILNMFRGGKPGLGEKTKKRPGEIRINEHTGEIYRD